MPTAPLRYCVVHGCTNRVPTGRCAIHLQEREQHRRRIQMPGGWRRWAAFRARYVSAHPWCVECQREGRRTIVEEVDHITPHRGNYELTYSEDNLQSLCKAHHSAKTAREVGWAGDHA